mmetsp:Transcript_41341/g.107051  ORF Transcript_41341/g.107051 Transcript_41341/m.107051 type:complete len:287 (+) Transcript_41341:223-1083(+)|eukprot:CAMPEP_0113871040 /NCGR_PEP_ID=MMETSP0780_2-20120614/2418_1 /TAXON_ID=652834 /ORGANISM="Palpitomonas bilix" /LENGTH=286 /DNA_ID=CAMNT_0000856379 /DNA_START=223 /DNA_END=1083 /DNA_ORIENTATION=+ /assembly_acc=CAM_ASM_000599
MAKTTYDLLREARGSPEADTAESQEESRQGVKRKDVSPTSSSPEELSRMSRPDRDDFYESQPPPFQGPSRVGFMPAASLPSLPSVLSLAGPPGATSRPSYTQDSVREYYMPREAMNPLSAGPATSNPMINSQLRGRAAPEQPSLNVNLGGSGPRLQVHKLNVMVEHPSDFKVLPRSEIPSFSPHSLGPPPFVEHKRGRKKGGEERMLAVFVVDVRSEVIWYLPERRSIRLPGNVPPRFSVEIRFRRRERDKDDRRHYFHFHHDDGTEYLSLIQAQRRAEHDQSMGR